MDNFFTRSWWVLALRGALAILFGVLAFMWPQLTLLVLVGLFAAFALLSGITAIVGALSNRKSNDDWWVVLLLGIVSVGAGIIAAFTPGMAALVLVLLIGANALVTGVLDIISAIRLRKAIEGEWMLALSGLVSIVFGAIVFFMPAAGALAMIWVISLYAVVFGAFMLVAAFRARAAARRRERPASERRTTMGDRRAAPAH